MSRIEVDGLHADGSQRYKQTKLKIDGDGRLDPQTTRTVRRLTPESAALLEALI